jgi:hypothetical protein
LPEIERQASPSWLNCAPILLHATALSDPPVWAPLEHHASSEHIEHDDWHSNLDRIGPSSLSLFYRDFLYIQH